MVLKPVHELLNKSYTFIWIINCFRYYLVNNIEKKTFFWIREKNTFQSNKAGSQ